MGKYRSAWLVPGGNEPWIGIEMVFTELLQHTTNVLTFLQDDCLVHYRTALRRNTCSMNHSGCDNIGHLRIPISYGPFSTTHLSKASTSVQIPGGEISCQNPPPAPLLCLVPACTAKQLSQTTSVRRRPLDWEASWRRSLWMSIG